MDSKSRKSSVLGSPVELSCPNCDETCKAHWMLCPVCGKPLTREQDQPQQQQRDDASATTEQSSADAERGFEMIPFANVQCDFHERSMIGSGSYGVVYRGSIRGTPVALKCIKSVELLFEANPNLDRTERNVMRLRKKAARQIEVLKKEQSIVRKCNNPNICLYLGATCDPTGNLVLVSELLEDDLNRYIRRQKQPSLYQCMQIAHQVAAGLSWIDGVVTHSDLKPSNILLAGLDRNRCWCDSSTVKVCDFGLGVVAQISDKVRGTPVYQSPESFNHCEATSRTDTYSFGWVLVNLITWRDEHRLFHRIKTRKQLEHFIMNEQGERFPFVKRIVAQANCPAVLLETVLSCLRSDPDERPSFIQLIDAFQQRVFLHSAIGVVTGTAMRFWCKYFRGTATLCTLKEFLAACGNEALTQESFTIGNRQQHLLDHLFAVEDTVTLENFGRIGGLMGPFLPLQDFFDRTSALIENTWFFGNTRTTTAAYALSNESPGTFLIRFSNNPAHSSDFALSRCYPEAGYIHHMHIRHKPESFCYAIDTRDVDLQAIHDLNHRQAILKEYASLQELVAGVRQALSLRQSLISLPRLLVGTLVRHNGYFVRPFLPKEDQDQHGLCGTGGLGGQYDDGSFDSSSEEDEEDSQGATLLFCKEYRRVRRSLASNLTLLQPWKQFWTHCGLRNLRKLMPVDVKLEQKKISHSGEFHRSPDFSEVRVRSRAASHFNLKMLSVRKSAARDYRDGAATDDCSGLLSALGYILYKLHPNRILIDAIRNDVSHWLRVNGDYVPANTGINETSLAQLSSQAGIEWDVYCDLVANGLSVESSDSLSQTLHSSIEYVIHKAPVYADYFILCALVEIYGISLVVITDEECKEAHQDPSLDNHFVFTMEPAPMSNNPSTPRSKIAVLGLAKNWFFPVIPNDQ